MNQIWESISRLKNMGFKTDGYLERWREPQRVYHGVDHIFQMLISLESAADFYGFEPESESYTLLELAAWYHDIVYNIGAKFNEEDSARLAIMEIADAEWAVEIFNMVLKTKDHRNPQTMYDAILIDMDLRGLGSEPFVYAKNCQKVRDEYGDTITDWEWCIGRASFIDGFLERPCIYYSSWGAQFETAARLNLYSELRELGRK